MQRSFCTNIVSIILHNFIIFFALILVFSLVVLQLDAEVSFLTLLIFAYLLNICYRLNIFGYALNDILQIQFHLRTLTTTFCVC